MAAVQGTTIQCGLLLGAGVALYTTRARTIASELLCTDFSTILYSSCWIYLKKPSSLIKHHTKKLEGKGDSGPYILNLIFFCTGDFEFSLR